MPIDYAGIAKQYGGVLEEDVVETAPEEVIDYDGIAKELGGVLEPSGVTGGTLEEQMMAAESEVPMLDAYGSPIMPPPITKTISSSDGRFLDTACSPTAKGSVRTLTSSEILSGILKYCFSSPTEYSQNPPPPNPPKRP